MWPQVNEAEEGITSITHYELLQAKETNAERAKDGGFPILAFLLDEYPWPPQSIDGFATTDPSAPPDNSAIRKLRTQLQPSESSPLPSPSDLEARVSTAVTMATAGLQSRG